MHTDKNVDGEKIESMSFLKGGGFTSIFMTFHNNYLFENVLVRTAPKLNQPLFLFINAVDVCK